MCLLSSTSFFYFFLYSFFFFFNDTATTEIYTLSLHDALPISPAPAATVQNETQQATASQESVDNGAERPARGDASLRSEEHTSELQSRVDLVCRLLLEKKKKKKKIRKTKNK